MTWTVMIEGRPDCKHEHYVHFTLTVEPPIPGVECLDCGRKIQMRPAKPNAAPWPEQEPATHWSLRETFETT